MIENKTWHAAAQLTLRGVLHLFDGEKFRPFLPGDDFLLGDSPLRGGFLQGHQCYREGRMGRQGGFHHWRNVVRTLRVAFCKEGEADGRQEERKLKLISGFNGFPAESSSDDGAE